MMRLALINNLKCFSYPLCLQMCASQAVHVLIEVHHLEAVELIRNLFDLLLLARLYDFDTFSIPLDVFAWRRLVLSTSLDGSTWNLSIVYICNLVV